MIMTGLDFPVLFLTLFTDLQIFLILTSTPHKPFNGKLSNLPQEFDGFIHWERRSSLAGTQDFVESLMSNGSCQFLSQGLSFQLLNR